MRDQIRHDGASQGDLDAALAALDDQTRTVIGGPIVTAWGQRTKPHPRCHLHINHVRAWYCPAKIRLPVYGSTVGRNENREPG